MSPTRLPARNPGLKTAKADVTPVRQRTQFTCMSTSMMMCLNALEHDLTEDEVNRVMGARPMKGASWEQALACAQHYGCRATLTMPSTVEQLKEWTDAGVPVMIAWNPEGRDWSHASVVFHVDDDGNVHVADPNIPDPSELVRVVPRAEFYGKWYEKWPDYMVRRPACAIDREITTDGKQKMASRTARTLTDRDGKRWGPKRGLEGPLHFKGGRVLYYSPREGYYDPTTDMFLSQQEADRLASAKVAAPGEFALQMGRMKYVSIHDWDSRADLSGKFRRFWDALGLPTDANGAIDEKEEFYQWLIKTGQRPEPRNRSHPTVTAWGPYSESALMALAKKFGTRPLRGRQASVSVKRLRNGDVVVNSGPSTKRDTLRLLDRGGWDRRIIQEEHGSWILPAVTVDSVDEVMKALSAVDPELRRAAARVANAHLVRMAGAKKKKKAPKQRDLLVKDMAERGWGSGKHQNRDQDVAKGHSRKEKHKKKWAAVDEKLFHRAAMLLQYMDEKAAAKQLMGEGISRGDAFLAVKAGTMLNKKPGRRAESEVEGGYKGNPGGEDIYPNEIDHGVTTEPLGGGHDIMRQLQNTLVHEQGDVVPQRPPSPDIARYSFDRETLSESARLVAADWLVRQESI